jgi:hypothetical protein
MSILCRIVPKLQARTGNGPKHPFSGNSIRLSSLGYCDRIGRVLFARGPWASGIRSVQKRIPSWPLGTSEGHDFKSCRHPFSKEITAGLEAVPFPRPSTPGGVFRQPMRTARVEVGNNCVPSGTAYRHATRFDAAPKLGCNEKDLTSSPSKLKNTPNSGIRSGSLRIEGNDPGL